MAIASIILDACSTANVTDINICDDVTNYGYIGNGVEWDPYDEAALWGCEISDNDWNELFRRLDVMQPQYVRCMINSPFSYWNAETQTYDRNRHSNNIKRLLNYCTENDITVIFGEYNPPSWDMKQSEKWIDMSVDYLNYLVMDCGMSCIKHFVIFNEPDGDWACTNGDYDLWLSMLKRFHNKMASYEGLLDAVSLAGPDVVTNYKNPASKYNTAQWMSHTSEDADSIIGIYDVHAYPGQHEVRSGQYASVLRDLASKVPAGKKILLGEAGFKYNQPEDSSLMDEYKRRVEKCSFTKGSDCNMLCYDFFYGLDMPMLAMEVMNNGLSGLALWMLDDAMHSSGDSGKTEDVKIWGLWNILGEEVFNKPEDETPRPLFYTWTLMCRYFPNGCNILKNSASSIPKKGLFSVCAEHEGDLSFAIVNVGDSDQEINVNFPRKFDKGVLYVYKENNTHIDSNNSPTPVQTGIIADNSLRLTIKAQSFLLLTNVN